MNLVPTKVLTEGAFPVRVSRRAQSKQRTREKILASARQLFSERGYEGATIRDIAKAAGMSTGAVFASFADKAELFDDILAADYRALEGVMAQAGQGAATAQAAVTALAGVLYGFHLRQLPLLRAAMSVSWTREPETERHNREAIKPILDLFGAALRAGAERGEISPQADLAMIRDMLWQAHVSGYRAAVFDGRTAEELTARFADQAQVILAGAKA